MPTDNAAAWDRHAAAYQEGARLPTDVAHYGPDIGTEANFRLCGNVEGKRVLELGCGGAQCSIAFARKGANAIGVDISNEQLAFARRLVAREGVKVELRHGDLADLAFVRADTMDLVFSAYAFGFIEDLDRVFRQVHRVLKPGGIRRADRRLAHLPGPRDGHRRQRQRRGVLHLDRQPQRPHHQRRLPHGRGPVQRQWVHRRLRHGLDR